MGAPTLSASLRQPLAAAEERREVVLRVVVERAAQDTRTFGLFSRIPALSAANIPLASVFVSPRRSPASRLSGRKRNFTAAARKLNAISTPVDGAAFGTFLGSLAHALRTARAGARTAYIVRTIKALLTPVGRAAATVQGVDGRALCLGLLSRRAVSTHVDALKARAAHVPPHLHADLGSHTTVVGACASIFVSFGVMLSRMVTRVDHAALERVAAAMLECDALDAALAAALRVLERCVPSQGYVSALPVEEAAVEAEERAIERARRGVALAKAFCARQPNYGALDTMETALAWYARAAWPSGATVNARTHAAFVASLSEPFFQQPLIRAPPQPAADVVPLSELETAANSSLMSDSDASSYAGTSHSSGASSLGLEY
jgi:hypothetical protein